MSVEPIDPRDVVISAGRQRLLTDGIDALRGLLNASVLSKDIPVSRDTGEMGRGQLTVVLAGKPAR